MTFATRRLARRLARWIVDRYLESVYPLAVVRFEIDGVSLCLEGEFGMKLPIGKKVIATVGFKDRGGNKADVDGSPKWSTDRPDILAIEAGEDGLSAVISPVGAIGTAQITVTADADLGEGVRELTVLGMAEVVAGDAVSGSIEFGELADVE